MGHREEQIAFRKAKEEKKLAQAKEYEARLESLKELRYQKDCTITHEQLESLLIYEEIIPQDSKLLSLFLHPEGYKIVVRMPHGDS